MAFGAQGYTVGNIVSEGGVVSEVLNVMRMQGDSLANAFSVVGPAFLAGVVISLKYSLAPFAVFDFATSYVILMGLVFVVGEAGAARFLCLFAGGWVGQMITSCRAVGAQPSALAILRHQSVALWARYLNGKASTADLILLSNVWFSLLTDPTAATYENALSHTSTISHKWNRGNAVTLERWAMATGQTPVLLDA